MVITLVALEANIKELTWLDKSKGWVARGVQAGPQNSHVSSLNKKTLFLLSSPSGPWAGPHQAPREHNGLIEEGVRGVQGKKKKKASGTALVRLQRNFKHTSFVF